MTETVTRVGTLAPSTIQSAVSWPAIFAGATVAIASTLILVAVGSGLGFAAASPWPGSGPSLAAFAIGTGIWLIVTQWLSAFLGGYITGRLRTAWTGVHTKEVVFRDTAHGLVSWAVATVIVGAVAFSVTSSSLGAASNASAATVASATDMMLRSDHAAAGDAEAVRGQLIRLIGVDSGVASSDRDYAAQVVARETGVSQAEARKRVDVAVTSIRQSADKARKASSAIGFFTALAMLIGAFIASAAAAYAGSLRDDHHGREIA